MKCLVTGAAGFVGSNLLKKLLDAGHKCWGIDNFSTGKKENLGNWGKRVVAHHDITNPIPEDHPYVDVVFHLAGKARIQPSFEYPILNFETNITGTANVLEWARKKNCRHGVVYAGSSSFYHDVYANPYTFTKHIGEEACLLYSKVFDIPVSIARFFNVYGPNQICEGAYATVIGIFEKQKAEGKPLTVTGTGEKRRDFTHVDDICQGLILMAEKGGKGQIFNLGTGRNHSILEVANLFKPDKIEFIPDRPGEADITLADLRLSRHLLGYEPTKKLEDYIREKS